MPLAALRHSFLTLRISEIVVSGTVDKFASISLAKSILKRDEDLLEAFAALHSFLKRISSLRPRISKLSLTDLPVELIVLIFEFAELGIKDLRRLLLVSKGFRQLVLSTPSLWAQQTLTPCLSPYAIDAIARLSGSLGLKARFVSGLDPHLLRDCERWTDLSLYGFGYSEMRHFQSNVPCARLAGLESLTLTTLDKSFPPPISWSLPSLKSLHCFMLVPDEVRSSVLSECSFHFDRFLMIDSLSRFLAATTRLERLTIALTSTMYPGATRSVKTEFGTETSLSTLKEFTLHSNDALPCIVDRLIKTLLFPNIKSFVVHCNDSGEIPCNVFAMNLFWKLLRGLRTRYSKLEYIQLKLKQERIDNKVGVITVDDILNVLPTSIQEVALTFENIEVRANNNFVGPFPNLRWIGFTDCNRLSPMVFQDLTYIFKEYGMLKVRVEGENCIESDKLPLVGLPYRIW